MPHRCTRCLRHKPMKLLAVFTTVSTIDDARRMAAALVERRLAACAQISPIESFYRWQGAVENEAEYRILFKTSAASYPAVEAAIRELHGYQLPAIHAVALDQVDAAYAKWVVEGASGGGSRRTRSSRCSRSFRTDATGSMSIPWPARQQRDEARARRTGPDGGTPGFRARGDALCHRRFPVSVTGRDRCRVVALA